MNTDSSILKEDVRWALRELAANLLRVLRGAGRPDSLAEQASCFSQAVNTYYASSPTYSLNFNDLLDGVEPCYSDYPESRRQFYDMDIAEWSIISGALQVAASGLLGQATQKTKGGSEMFGGIRELEEAKKKYCERV